VLLPIGSRCVCRCQCPCLPNTSLLTALLSLVVGGGSGGPVPYRLYIDSGVVLMWYVVAQRAVYSVPKSSALMLPIHRSTLALAPASPIVAPACFLYFLVCQPLMRRNLIYMYRPRVRDVRKKLLFGSFEGLSSRVLLSSSSTGADSVGHLSSTCVSALYLWEKFFSLSRWC
jgi:hypothetical protein